MDGSVQGLYMYVVHPSGATFNCNDMKTMRNIKYLVNLIRLNYFVLIWYQSTDFWWRNQSIGVQSFVFDDIMMRFVSFCHLVITNSDIGALINIPMEKHV